MFGQNGNMSQMMPFMQMMMQGGQNPFSSPQGGMPSVQNSAPQIPMAQRQGGGSIQAPPMPQQNQQPGFFQNMMSSPQNMASGLALGNKASGIFGGESGASMMAPDGMGAAGGSAGGINWNPWMGTGAPNGLAASGYPVGQVMGAPIDATTGAATGAFPTALTGAGAGSSPFWGGLSSMMGGSGQATGLMSLLGLA